MESQVNPNTNNPVETLSEANKSEEVVQTEKKDSPVHPIELPEDVEKKPDLEQSATLSPSRAMKIEDPERVSHECVSNMLTGCHLDDALEENKSSFINGKKQLIILTAAGKPVYSYGRDEEDLANVTGIIQALDSNFISMGEHLKYIETNKGYFVLETIDSLIFFCYSPKEGTTVLLIRELFRLLYQQIIMILSKNAIKRLEKQPNYDLREVLGNSASHLTSVITQSEISLSLLFQCYKPLMIAPQLRNQIRDLFIRMKRPDTVYCGLGINNSNVICLQNKQFPLSSINQTLLFNLITTSVAFRSSEAWLPICITDVKDDAYLHLYVGFVTEEMYVFFVTTANSPDVFTEYSEMKNQLYNVLLQTDRIIELYSAYNSSLSVNEPGIPDLIHFLYKNDLGQVVIPKIDERIYDYHDYYNLIRKYQLTYSHMLQNNLNDYYENTSEYCITASKAGTSIFIVVCSPFLSVEDVMERKQKVGDWLVKRRQFLIAREHLFV